MTAEQAHETLRAHGLVFDGSERAKEQFLRACKEGKTEAVRAYIALGADLECREDISEETPLIRATEGKHLDVIDLLIDAGAHLEGRDSPGDTALMTAVNWSHDEAVAHLLERGADANAFDNYRWSPLTKAMREGHDDYFALMLQHGGDPNYGAETDDAALQYALREDDYDKLRQLLDAGGDPDLRDDKQGNTLLISAVEGEHSRCIELLLERGASLEKENYFGWTAWMCASYNGLDAIARTLRSKGAKERPLDAFRTLFTAAQEGDLEALRAFKGDLNLRDQHGTTALMKAASENHHGCVAYLLEAGVDRHALDYDQCNALYYAAQENAIESLKLLLDAGLDPNKEPPPYRDHTDKIDALYWALDHGSAEMFQLLAQAGADITELGHLNTTWLYGSLENHQRIAIIELLGAMGGDLNAYGQFGEPIFTKFAYAGEVEVLEALLKAGVDVNVTDKNGYTALHQVCMYNSDNRTRECMELLLGAGIRYTHRDVYGNTPLHDARSYSNDEALEVLEAFIRGQLSEARKSWGERPYTAEFYEEFASSQDAITMLEWLRWGERELVEGLLRAGVSPNPAPPYSEHPLEVALKSGDRDMVALLLEHGADPCLIQVYGGTPLHTACSEGSPEIVALMLKAGADPNVLNNWGEAPLQAAMADRPETLAIARLLLDAGADINLVKAGWSPVIRAAQNGLTPVIRWLLARGADVNVRNERQKNALAYAVEGEHISTIRLLLDAGIDVDVRDDEQSTPLIDAVKKGNREIIGLLLAAGADPQIVDGEGCSAFDYAQYRDELKSIFSTPDAASTEVAPPLDAEHPMPPLLRAIYNRDDAEAHRLLAAGADPNSRNYRGDTALMLSIARQEWGLFEALLDAGADVLATNELGDHAWSFAMVYAGGGEWKERIERAGFTISMDALNQQASMLMRTSAFQESIDGGDIAAVDKSLQAKEIDLNLLNSYVRPIEIAIGADDLPMLRMLLERGADPTLCDEPGRDALFLARQIGSRPLIQLLEEALRQRGLSLHTPANFLEGKRVYVAGAFKGRLQKDIKESLQQAGAEIASTLNYQVDLCVVAPRRSAAAQEKADLLGVEIWTQDELEDRGL